MYNDINKLINKENIKNSLSNLSYKELNILASKIREEIIDSTSKNGGHLSSNLGVVELTIALHRNFDFKKDKLLFDVGHQCYTHKILTGRSLSKLRKKDGVSGFIKLNESPYDIFEAGHSSTSLSAALAFAIDRDNKKEDYDVVALIGDGSIANGVAFEALNNIPSADHKVIIILNDNDMSISTPVGGLSNVFRKFQTSKSYLNFKKGFKKILGLIKPIYTLANNIKNWFKRHLIATNIFDSLGYIYIGVVDGHDFKALDNAIKKAKKVEGPVIIHVRTIKGKGYKYAETDKTGYWHGVTPFDKKSGLPLVVHPDKISWSHLYANIVTEKLKSDDKFILIGAGTLKGSGLSDLIKEYPDRVFDTGISEEHAFVLAGQLAHLGYHVVVSIYSTFMQRSFDQINHDIARIHSPVTVLVDRSGLVGNDGDTHQGIYDSSFLFATPNINVVMARDASDAYSLFNEAINSKEATFIRYPRALLSTPKVNGITKINSFNILKLSNSNKCVIVSEGPLTDDLLKELADVDVTIFNIIKLKPIPKELIDSILKYQNLVVYTPYETSNGFAQALIEELVNLGFKSPIFIRAIPLTFVSQMSIEEQLENFNLLPTQISKFIIELVKEE